MMLRWDWDGPVDGVLTVFLRILKSINSDLISFWYRILRYWLCILPGIENPRIFCTSRMIIFYQMVFSHDVDFILLVKSARTTRELWKRDFHSRQSWCSPSITVSASALGLPLLQPSSRNPSNQKRQLHKTSSHC
jgi:hypothetical protein